MQEVRWFKPSTVSRRFSVTAGFYRTCVIDGVLEHSPAEYVHRPSARNAVFYGHAQRVPARVVLIDGRMLAELMVKHNIGVQDQETYVIRRLDEDFLEEAD
jgi:restriction endonuclease Mrr